MNIPWPAACLGFVGLYHTMLELCVAALEAFVEIDLLWFGGGLLPPSQLTWMSPFCLENNPEFILASGLILSILSLHVPYQLSAWQARAF